MNAIIYRIFIAIYPLLAKVLAITNKKAAIWVVGRKDIFIRLQAAIGERKGHLVWVHCASLGEFEQGRPIIEAIKQKDRNTKILLTFFSPSGYEIRKQYELADWVFYLPMDSPLNAKKWLDLVKPNLVLFVKYEFWYYYLREAQKQNIPLWLVSGVFRASQPFFKWYGKWNKQMLGFIDVFFVQDKNSAQLLQSIGVEKNVFVAGDTRFDRVLTIAKQFSPIEAIEKFINGNELVVVAGSTWIDDDILLNEYAQKHPEIKFIIAPHHIDEARILECIHLYKAIKWSDWVKKPASPASNVLIIDNIGMLSKLYHFGTICFIGGGFTKDGIHNTLEAAVYFKPILFGPVYHKYQEAIDLINISGAYSVAYIEALEDKMNILFNDTNAYQKASEASGNYVATHSGATNKIVQMIYEKRLLTN